MRRILLISNSTCYGQGYLDFCLNEITSFLSNIKTVLFIPYALKNTKQYFIKTRSRFVPTGIKITSIEQYPSPKAAIKKARAILVGGGNTFRLLNRLYQENLIDRIRRKVTKDSIPYIGISAGANIACPTIKTTNDMPIVQPPSLQALNIIPFQINPHFLDKRTNTKSMGETREERIIEYFEENKIKVIGLREGSMLKIEDSKILLKGLNGAKIFYSTNKTQELKPEAEIFI
jgi:dipeptidase E